DALGFFSLRPQDRIALTAENDHVRAWTVLVPLLISPDGEFRDMRTYGVFRQVELHVGAALAALVIVGELERVRVRHEVGRQKETPSQLALAAEVTCGARIESVSESIIAVEDVVGVVKQIHHEATVG